MCNFLAIFRGEEMLTDESQILEDFGDGRLRSRDHSECAHFGDRNLRQKLKSRRHREIRLRESRREL